MLPANDLLVDEEDRPQFPPAIIRAEVLENPFDDLAPRPGVVWNREEKKIDEKR